MSQQTLIADVATWGPDQCQKQLHQALPKLVQYLNNAKSLEKEKEIIQLICQSFLPVISPEQAEHVLFSKVAHKAAACVDQGLGLAEQTAGHAQTGSSLQSASKKIEQLMQYCMDLIGCLVSCVNHVTPAEGQVEMTFVHSLPASVLHVIERSYSHCKESSRVYGELLGSLSHQLSLMFRQANSLQTALIGLLDKIQLGLDCSEQDAQNMVIAIHGLFEISQVAVSLEIKVMLTLWKAISRLSCKHKETLRNRLELDQMITCLCTDMCATYGYMSTLPGKDGGNNNFVKTSKVLGFQVRLLQLFVREFEGQIGTGVKSIYNLVLTLRSKVQPSFSVVVCPEALLEELERQVIVGITPLIASLITDRDFALCVTRTKQDLPVDHRLPWLLTILDIMEQLPTCSDEVQELWLDPVVRSEDETRSGLLSVIFTALFQCGAEVSVPVLVPGVMTNGKPQRMVSLYEMVVTKLSAFVACLPARHFHLIESVMLEKVLGRQSLPALLAADIWCFVARYGTADVCRDHCMLIAHLLHQVALNPTPQCCHLVVLLQRLLRFMASEHQADFIDAYPVTSHIGLWSVVPLAIFTPSHLQPLVNQLVPIGTKNVNEWLGKTQKTTADAKALLTGLQILNNVTMGDGVITTYLTGEQRMRITSLCVRLWEHVVPHHVTGCPPLQAVNAALYRLSASAVPYLEDGHVLKILLKSSSLLSCHPPVSLKVSILGFLESIAKKQFKSPEEARVLVNLPALYRRLMLDGHVAVHQTALQTFAHFAEETPHETAVPAAIQTDPRLQQIVISYLNQEAGQDVVKPHGQLPQQAEQVEKSLSSPSSALYPAPVWPVRKLHNNPQAAKRQRCDDVDANPVMSYPVDDNDAKCSTSLEEVRHGVMSLAALRRNAPLPAWVCEQLQVIQIQLTELL